MATVQITNENIHIYSSVGAMADILIDLIKIINFGEIMSPEMKMEWIENTIKKLQDIKENDERVTRGT